MARKPLLEALGAYERLVLLGDIVELRQGPVREALAVAEGVLRAIGGALGAGREVVIVPGNHDHHLLSPWLERRARDGTPRPLGLETEIDWRSGEALASIATWLHPAEVRAAYPGVWLREDVYATHGHYGDRHTTVPMFERLGAGAMARIVREPPGGPARAEDYEAALAPIYAWLHAIAQGRDGEWRGPEGREEDGREEEWREEDGREEDGREEDGREEDGREVERREEERREEERREEERREEERREEERREVERREEERREVERREEEGREEERRDAGDRGSGRALGGGSARAWEILTGADGRRSWRRRAIVAAFPALIAALNRAGLAPLRADLSGAELRRAALRAQGEVVGRLQIQADHLIFGHTHRAGPLAGDDASEWRVRAGARLINSGCWVHEPAFLGLDPRTSPYRPGFAVSLSADGPPELTALLDQITPLVRA